MMNWARKNFVSVSAATALLVVFVDQILKHLVRSGAFQYTSSWVDLTPHFNEGILGGWFSTLHPWIIRIFFSVLFGFIALLTSLFLHLIRHKEIWRLKYGIVLYISGVLGNVCDRALTGQITDFLNLNLPFFRNYAFNFADCVLMAGMALTVFSLVRDHHRIWYAQNKRKSLIIESRFQFGFSAFLAFMAAMNALIVAIYSFTFLKVYLDTAVSPMESSDVIHHYLLGLFVIEIGFLLITVGVGLVFSHRMVGPIYAFERYVERIMAAPNDQTHHPFRLRNMDYFKSLEKTAQLILERFRSRP